jgi:drug/metabolite transporter (DMT)-like permease
MATSFIWVSILSPIFFPTDSTNSLKWLGIAIIIIGVWFVAKGGKK